ncbi:MAG TPA: hypothetical protein VGB63_06150 [Pedobacter sp.]
MSTWAAPCPGPDDEDWDPNCVDPDNAPLDSGVGLLIGAVAFYTVNTIRKKSKHSDSDN